MKKRIVFCALALATLASVAVPNEANKNLKPRISDGKVFIHPGISYTQADFDRMKAMIAAGQEPWKRGFEALKTSRFANPHVGARWRGGRIEAGRFNNTIGFDGRITHDLALMWKLTGEDVYAERVRDFLVQNANYESASGAGTGPLDNGKIYLLVEAAELIRDFPGWTKEDQEKFKEMLRRVFIPHIRTGDVMRWGNQGLTAYHGLLACAVFLDDVKMYDRVWNNAMGLPHRPDDDPYAPGDIYKPGWPLKDWGHCVERTARHAFGNIEDWGYDDQLRFYIYQNGQSQEACRDQGHALYGIFQFASIAEIFWNQGDDMYSALDNRILLGLEWALRYNKSDWEPKGFEMEESKVTFENELFYRARSRCRRWEAVSVSPHGRGNDGGPAAPKMGTFMRYAVCLGVPKDKTKWLREAVRAHHESGYENWGVNGHHYEWNGWGTVTKTRSPFHVGEPGTWEKGVRVPKAHQVPGVIHAVDFDFHPSPSERRRSAYYPGAPLKPSTIYRNDAQLPITRVGEKYCLGSLKKGEWCDYTLSVPKTGRYKLAIHHRHGGTLKVTIAIDGKDKVTRQFAKSSRITKSDLGTIELEAGAPVLRLKIDAASGANIFAITLED